MYVRCSYIIKGNHHLTERQREKSKDKVMSRLSQVTWKGGGVKTSSSGGSAQGVEHNLESLHSEHLLNEQNYNIIKNDSVILFK